MPTEDLAALEGKTAEQIIAWIGQNYAGGAALASSFGVEDMVLIDMIARVAPSITIFSLDTGRLPEETYRLVEAARERYHLPIQVYYPNTAAVERMATEKGLNLFYGSVEARKECCRIRKVEPLGRALHGKKAWITGLRREQSQARGTVAKGDVDADHGGMLKFSPLADWTEAMVWEYVRAHEVPYSELHDRGFPSIGCAPCTRAVAPGEDMRSGRWWWEQGTKECGLHEHAAPAAAQSALRPADAFPAPAGPAPLPR